MEFRNSIVPKRGCSVLFRIIRKPFTKFYWWVWWHARQVGYKRGYDDGWDKGWDNGYQAAADDRFGLFNGSELSELVISLDHRLGEAKKSNAYVYTDIVKSLFREAAEREAAKYGNEGLRGRNGRTPSSDGDSELPGLDELV